MTMTAGSTPWRNATFWRQLAILLAALVLSRALFIVFMPATYSTDLYSWMRVMEVLQAGGNPYNETGVLNWPPFWMQILFGLHHLSKATGIRATHLVQATLVGGECLVLVTTYAICRRFFPQRDSFRPLLFGLALNPVCIFLSCQHCNYDVFVGLFVLLAGWMLAEWHVTESREAWLAACFFIGLGILAKTVPIMLTPLLLLRFRRLPLPTRLFGVLLAAAPFTIGMSVLFTLAPYGVMQHVIGYRSLTGWYGITGWLLKAGWIEAMDAYQRISPVLFIGLMALMAWWSYRKSSQLTTQTVLALPALMLVFVTTAGPGYSPPYIFWYLPLLLVLYVAGDRPMRRMVLAGWLITIPTYIAEYALFNSHGAFLLQWLHSARLSEISEWAGSRGGQILIRLPMFLWHIALFAGLVRTVRNDAPVNAPSGMPSGQST